MPRVFVCEECDGRGVQTYDRGPVVERCPGCAGVGVRFADRSTAARDLEAAVTGSADAALATLGEGGLLRAVAHVAAELEARCETLERELGR